MKILEILTEARSRIEHPEDRILDDGSWAALEAMKSLFDAANSSRNISVKFDGTPALIAGNIQGKFVMTDKAGLAKQIFAKTPQEMYSMIFDRKSDQPGRSEYATKLSELYSSIQKMIPKSFAGLVQFDVMWFDEPTVNPKTKMVEFQPNKVLYTIPVDSDLGKSIVGSHYGIVVHSYFERPDDEEPHGISDIRTLRLNPVQGLVVLDPKASFEVKADPVVLGTISKTEKFVNDQKNAIDSFINKANLAALKISDLPAMMKKFQAQRSRGGKGVTTNIQGEFLQWLKTAPISDSKKKNSLEYIKSHVNGYKAVWVVVSKTVEIKNHILAMLEKLNTSIRASINGVQSHEGYVVDAPSGKIKLVNRPLFMKTETK